MIRQDLIITIIMVGDSSVQCQYTTPHAHTYTHAREHTRTQTHTHTHTTRMPAKNCTPPLH